MTSPPPGLWVGFSRQPDGRYWWQEPWNCTKPGVFRRNGDRHGSFPQRGDL